jgi:acetoin utilization protein AcuB
MHQSLKGIRHHHRRNIMRVKEYMSASPLTIHVDEDYGAAFDIMQTRDLHHLPVINAKDEIVGIVARRDLQLAARFFHEAQAEIADVMHAPVVTIDAEASLATAAERMASERIGCLPVIDADRHLVGMLTETDLFRALRDLLEAQGVGTEG